MNESLDSIKNRVAAFTNSHTHTAASELTRMAQQLQMLVGQFGV